MPIKYLCNAFCIAILSYTFLYSIFYLMPNNFIKYGLFNNELNFLSLVQHKAKLIAYNMHETNLGLNFIGNFHELSKFEAKVFQSSGLVHLLAISGAQILPVVSLVCFLSAMLLHAIFKNKFKPHEIMKLCSIVRLYCSFFISLFIALLFGATGALLRVSWLNFFKKINILSIIKRFIFNQTAEFIEPLLDKFFILFIVSFLFGNIFTNYSFILSAIGASCAEIAAYICMLLFRNKNNDNNNFINKILNTKFFLEIIVTILTCLLVGLILSPLTTNSLFNACLANIFAIPIITFLVTPLSLLVIIIPVHSIFFHLVLQGFDYSLSIFKYIAIIFSDINTVTNTINLKLFSADGLLYLNTIMIILWVIVDLIRGRKIFLMRLKLKLADNFSS